jgi:membrane protein
MQFNPAQFLPFLKYVYARFFDDQCMRSAAALTYMSLFALVPLMTVMYAMVSAIPAFQGVGEQVQAFMFDNLVPSAGAEIETYLSDFSRQTRNLTGVGIGFLIVTAVLMLRNIESAFNIIWRSRANRSTIASFLLYWAVLSLGPVFIGLALGISTYLTSAAVLFEDFDLIGVTAALLKLAPVLLSAAAFTLIYAAVPNTPVPIKHALIGGIATAIIFNIARSMFTKLVVGSSYTVIYGAFAAFPLFLLWIYVSWNIVLAGGVLVHSLSAFQTEQSSRKPLLLKALSVLHLFWQRQQAGVSISEISLLKLASPDTLGLDSDTWAILRDIFLRRNLICIDENGKFLLSRDLHEVPLWQLKEWVNTELPLEGLTAEEDSGWQSEAMALLQGQRQHQRELMQLSLAELFTR